LVSWSETVSELILSLDLPRAADALVLVERLPELRWVKVGSILMTQEGPSLVERLVARGLKVFLDLKWHDIPNTVAGAVAAARELGVSMATVHVIGGSRMLESAVAAAKGDLALVGVTVLTSFDSVEYARTLGRPQVDLPQEVERQALFGMAAGLRGIVCSPHEVSLLRRRLGPGPYIVVPGVRRRSDPRGDQIRVATAQEAADHGATHLVVGRPILEAPDPALALEEFMKEARCAAS
jgi:orotidine-5'-phosphate decarboxylase